MATYTVDGNLSVYLTNNVKELLMSKDFVIAYYNHKEEWKYVSRF